MFMLSTWQSKADVSWYSTSIMHIKMAPVVDNEFLWSPTPFHPRGNHSMMFSTMKAPPTMVVLAALVIVCALPNSVQGRSLWGNRLKFRSNDLFGLTQLPSGLLLSTRGGATKASPEEEPREEETPVELYLPGLLDAVVVKSTMVRAYCLGGRVAMQWLECFFWWLEISPNTFDLLYVSLANSSV
jgi:hypothetical protein